MGVQISTSVSIIDSLFGFQAISLTAFDTASVPTIAAGSKVEIAGAFFSFTSDESINATSWSAITTGDTAYITLTPAGTAGTQTVTAAWTSTAPEWSDSKQGYYLTAGSTIRYIGGCDKTEATEYSNKFLYNNRSTYGDNGALFPTKDPIISSYLLQNATATYILPRGVYNITLPARADGDYTAIECNMSGGWRLMYIMQGGNEYDIGGFVISDGTNVRIRNNRATTAYTFYYQKY